jgi:hypothetical protein
MERRLLEAIAGHRNIVLDSTGMSARFRAMLRRHPGIIHVHLHCDERAYKAREASRTDRKRAVPTRAYRQSACIQFELPPRITIDTSELQPQDVYRAVKASIRLEEDQVL